MIHIIAQAMHRIQLLKASPTHPLDGYDSAKAADLICEHADAFIAPEEHKTKKGKAHGRESREAIIDAIAHCAFVPGGLHLFDRHIVAEWLPPEKREKLPFLVGDSVRYTAKFLRSTGQYFGETPRLKGRIVSLRSYGIGKGCLIASVDWGNGPDSDCPCEGAERPGCTMCYGTGKRYMAINTGNLEHTQLTAKQREEGWRELSAIFG